MTTTDSILVYEESKTRKRPGGWRYRFWKAGEEDPLYTSSLVFPTRDEATSVARKVNALMFGGGYKLRRKKGAS